MLLIWFLYQPQSVRTAQGIFFFPRAFFLLFCLVHFYMFSFPFGFSYVAVGMIVCFMLQCTTFFWNRYEVPAVALGLVGVNQRNSIINNFNISSGEIDFLGSTRGNNPRPRQTVNTSESPSRNSSNADQSTARIYYRGTRDDSEEQEPLIRVSLQPQYQQRQQQIHYTYSQGTFSQGLLSRASSEAIFHTSTDEGDESESCVYFLGGEVVIRRADARGGDSGGIQSGGDSGGDFSQLNRYDSTSTIQSAALLGTIADEAMTSGLQAIHDLTPRLCNTSRAETGSIDDASRGAPVFPVLDSSRSKGRQRQHQSN